MAKDTEYEAHAPLMSGDGVHEYGSVTDVVLDSSGSGSESDAESDVQDGVRRIEAVARTWSKWGLVVAYMRFVESSGYHRQTCR